jgi:hypothetical protein
VKDEIVIKRSAPGIPTLSFIDLPGIRSHPESLRVASESIVESYIADPNTLVICVMEA